MNVTMNGNATIESTNALRTVKPVDALSYTESTWGFAQIILHPLEYLQHIGGILLQSIDTIAFFGTMAGVFGMMMGIPKAGKVTQLIIGLWILIKIFTIAIEVGGKG